jgi:hypothetical protein
VAVAVAAQLGAACDGPTTRVAELCLSAMAGTAMSSSSTSEESLEGERERQRELGLGARVAGVRRSEGGAAAARALLLGHGGKQRKEGRRKGEIGDRCGLKRRGRRPRARQRLLELVHAGGRASTRERRRKGGKTVHGGELAGELLPVLL